MKGGKSPQTGELADRFHDGPYLRPLLMPLGR
jgi:hypothetical protein